MDHGCMHGRTGTVGGRRTTTTDLTRTVGEEESWFWRIDEEEEGSEESADCCFAVACRATSRWGPCFYRGERQEKERPSFFSSSPLRPCVTGTGWMVDGRGKRRSCPDRDVSGVYSLGPSSKYSSVFIFVLSQFISYI